MSAETGGFQPVPTSEAGVVSQPNVPEVRVNPQAAREKLLAERDAKNSHARQVYSSKPLRGL